MKTLITSTFAIMILAGAAGTLAPDSSNSFGSQGYWDQQASEYS